MLVSGLEASLYTVFKDLLADSDDDVLANSIARALKSAPWGKYMLLRTPAFDQYLCYLILPLAC
jgi:hypothetical protein